MLDQYLREKWKYLSNNFSIFYRKRWTHSDPCEPRSRLGRHTERQTRALVHSTGENALLFPAAEVTGP
jgi:hypothetical protein